MILVRWLVDVGRWVERGQELAEISTDEVNFGVPSPRSGRVAKLLYEEGAELPPRGGRILFFEGEDEAASPPRDS